jgi:hypothetical protein
MMKPLSLAAIAAAASLALVVPAFAAPAVPGQGQAVITLMPKDEAIPTLQPQDIQLKVDGKQTSVTSLAPAKGPNSPLELVLLIDSGARASLGTQMNEIQDFVKEIPANTKIAIAYMENGRAAFSGPLSSDPAQVLNGLHLPSGGAGISASPYFCLSDLAKNWPSHDPTARREVVMISDGVDDYNRRYDPEDPYVQAAITDSIRSGLVVYSIYWTSRGRINGTAYESNAGQNLLLAVTQATGGNSYWEGTGNPVSFDPYFRDLRVRFQNQYKVGFTSELKGKAEVASFNLKVSGPSAKVVAPHQVYVSPAGAGE